MIASSPTRPSGEAPKTPDGWNYMQVFVTDKPLLASKHRIASSSFCIPHSILVTPSRFKLPKRVENRDGEYLKNKKGNK